MKFLLVVGLIPLFYWSTAAEDYVDELLVFHPNNSCSHDDDCNDFRMLCQEEECVCSRFYKWSYEANECILQLDVLKEFLANMKEERDIKSELYEDTHRTFFFFALSGLMTASLGLLGVLACICILCLSKMMDSEDVESNNALLNEKKRKMIKDGDGGIADMAATSFKTTF